MPRRTTFAELHQPLNLPLTLTEDVLDSHDDADVPERSYSAFFPQKYSTIETELASRT